MLKSQEVPPYAEKGSATSFPKPGQDRGSFKLSAGAVSSWVPLKSVMRVPDVVGKGGWSAEIGVSTCRNEDFDAESFREKIYLVTK
jgi:hypothetical protein